jgi:hypothetical protein
MIKVVLSAEGGEGSSVFYSGGEIRGSAEYLHGGRGSVDCRGQGGYRQSFDVIYIKQRHNRMMLF